MWETFRHYFTPHHTNNFKPRLLQVELFIVYLLILSAVGFSLKFGNQLNKNILGFATDIRVTQLVQLTNEKRTQNGAPLLRLDETLSQAAARKAADMFAQDYWAHTAPDGKTPWDFINGVGYVYSVAGENLAKNFEDSEGVVTAWMNSPSHRENLLRSTYEDVGFAIVNGTLGGEETTLVVQMFGKRAAGVPRADKKDTTPQLKPAQAAPARVDVGNVSGANEQTDPSVVQTPFINIGAISKQVTFFFIALLLLTLVVDAVYIWRHKIVRIGGKTIAHILFLITLTGIVGMLSLGSIL